MARAHSTLRRLGAGATIATAVIAGETPSSGCQDSGSKTQLKGQVHLTLVHTSDIHSRLFPYNLQIGQVDAGLGLGATGTIANVGGVARMSYLVGRERARSGRFLHLDGGDCFQGAPVFNFFRGEAEIRALSAMGTDAMIVANHEFDTGAKNLGDQLQKWATFPVLAANYVLEDAKQPGASPLGTIFQPFSVFDVEGLRVAVLGLGNLLSLTSIFDAPNRLGITPLNTTQITQAYIDLLRPNVDVIVAVAHLGLENDQELIEETTGLDVILGGHNHIVLQPPKHVQDCSRLYDEEVGSFYIEVQGAESGKVEKRYCRPRDVILAHSGAFAKYLGRLDLVLSNDPADIGPNYDPLNGFEVLTNDFQLFPINDTVPEDPIVASLLEPYAQGLDVLANLELLVGYAPDGSRRSSTAGGDSPLGNMISNAMWLRLGIQTDFSLTNTTGIRADLVPGPVTVEQMYNIFPFDNSISKMQLSGVELQQLFDFVARRSAGRGCVSQVQIAGARIVVDCSRESVTDEGTSIGRGQATGIFIGAAQDGKGNTARCTQDSDCPIHLALCSEFQTADTKDPDNGKLFCSGLKDAAGKKIPCTQQEECQVSQFGQCEPESGVCWQPIDPFGYYELATSNYLAGGGSGFRVLQRNTTQFDTKVQQRDALIDYIRAGTPCGAGTDSGELRSCTTDAECLCQDGADPSLCNAEAGTYVCACPESVTEGPTCEPSGNACTAGGKCVLAACRRDVAAFQRETCTNTTSDAVRQSCEESITPCASGGEQCKFLACVDRGLGNFTDNRLRMIGQ